MSSTDSDSKYATTSAEIVPENIIREVRKRPALYDNTSEQYKDRKLKATLWEEVYQAVYDGYDDLSPAEKKDKGDLILKKWKNMRDSYTKDLPRGNGKPSPKKRKYIYFDLLSFLAPYLLITDVSADKVSHPPPNGSETAESNILDERPRDDSRYARKKKIQPPTQTSNNPAHKNNSKNDNDFENQLLDVLRKKAQDDEYDEDKSFAQMVVAMMKKLNDDQRHYAKVEILNVMQTAKSYPFVTSYE